MADKKIGTLPEIAETFSQSIAMRLRAVRKAAGFRTEKSFARKYGIPLSTYSQHETGKRKMAVETVVDYCKKLGINICWLLTGAGETWSIFQAETASKAIVATSSTRFSKKELDLLRIIFRAAKPFLAKADSQLLQWIDDCVAIWSTSLLMTCETEKIEKKVRETFLKKEPVSE